VASDSVLAVSGALNLKMGGKPVIRGTRIPVDLILRKLGTGATTAFPPAALAEALAARGIGIEAMDSRAAARTWGLLRAEGRRIAAALLPL